MKVIEIFLITLLFFLCNDNSKMSPISSYDEIILQDISYNGISLDEIEVYFYINKNFQQIETAMKYYNKGEPAVITMEMETENYIRAIMLHWQAFSDSRDETGSGYYRWNSHDTNSIQDISNDSEYLDTLARRFIMNDVQFPSNENTCFYSRYHENFFIRKNVSPVPYLSYRYGQYNMGKTNVKKMSIYIGYYNSSMLIEDITIGGNSINELKEKAEFIFSRDISWHDYNNTGIGVEIRNIDGNNINVIARPNFFTIFGGYLLKIVLEDVTLDPSDEIRIFARPFKDPERDFGDKYNNEFGDYYDGWVWDKKLLYNEITDIRLFTQSQIRLFINFFYAIHGYDFKNPIYKNYFNNLETFFDKNNLNYVVDPNFSVDKFNEYERKNIDYLVRLEKLLYN